MPDDVRIRQLLDEIVEFQSTPEDVCGPCPDLLPQVRDRWRQMCQAQADLDALFPPLLDPGASLPKSITQENALPAIPDYEVMAMLGAGGMGVVFQARHLRLNRVVALKMALDWHLCRPPRTATISAGGRGGRGASASQCCSDL